MRAKNKMLAGLLLALLGASGICQVVEESRTTGKERRESSSQAGQAISSMSVGSLFFGHLGMIESFGAEYVGYSPDEVKQARDLLHEVATAGTPMLPTGAALLESWNVMCPNFSRTSYTYTHHPELVKDVKRSGGRVTNIQDAWLTLSMPMVATPAVTEFAIGTYGESVGPSRRFMCLMMQTAVVEQAVKSLREMQPSVYSMPTEKAIMGALRGGAERWREADSAKRILSIWDKVNEGDCQVPTPTGLQAGKKSVLCGPLAYDMEARRFVFSGMVMLDEQTVMGRQVAFVRSTAAEKSQARSKASSQKEAVKVLK